MDLNTVWFILVACSSLATRCSTASTSASGCCTFWRGRKRSAQVHVAAIGPVWDGNEVWLLTGGGALFAAFPVVYATVFSGFYLALMLLLVALIARAVSLEFRAPVRVAAAGRGPGTGCSAWGAWCPRCSWGWRWATCSAACPSAPVRAGRGAFSAS